MVIFCCCFFQHQLQQVTQQQNNLQTNNAQSLLQDKMPRGGKSVKPRGRMTAYAFFVQTCRQEHKKKHPEENIIFQEFSKKCASRWKVSEVSFNLQKKIAIQKRNFGFCLSLKKIGVKKSLCSSNCWRRLASKINESEVKLLFQLQVR